MNLFRKEMAMKRLMILKNGSGEAFDASSPRFTASSLHRCQHYIHAENLHKTVQVFPTHCVKAKMT
jgi:hypothetical protein